MSQITNPDRIKAKVQPRTRWGLVHSNPFEPSSVSPANEPLGQTAKTRAAWCFLVALIIHNAIYVYGMVRFHDVIVVNDDDFSRLSVLIFVSLIIATSFLTSLPIAWITVWRARNRLLVILATLFLHAINFLVFGGFCLALLMDRLIVA